MGRALSDAEQRTHAELLHGRHIEYLDIDAELSQARRPAREFAGIEHVRRLVDEIARQHHAVGDGGGLCPGFFRRGGVGAGEIDFDLFRPLVIVFALGLVALECVGPQPRAKHQVRHLFALERAGAEFGAYRRLGRHRGHFAHGDTAKLDHVLALELAVLAGADHDKARHVEAGRRHDLESGAVFAGEVVRRSGATDEIRNRG